MAELLLAHLVRGKSNDFYHKGCVSQFTTVWFLCSPIIPADCPPGKTKVERLVSKQLNETSLFFSALAVATCMDGALQIGGE